MKKDSNDTTETKAINHEPLLCPVNAQCYNCLHFWNVGGEYQKGKCTDPRGRYYKKVVNFSDVCDLFDPI